MTPPCYTRLRSRIRGTCSTHRCIFRRVLISFCPFRKSPQLSACPCPARTSRTSAQLQIGPRVFDAYRCIIRRASRHSSRPPLHSVSPPHWRFPSHILRQIPRQYMGANLTPGWLFRPGNFRRKGGKNGCFPSACKSAPRNSDAGQSVILTCLFLPHVSVALQFFPSANVLRKSL